MTNHTKVHFDFDTMPWLTSPRRQLELTAVALGLIRLPRGEGYSFTHRHERQEEVYVVIGGSGVLLVDGELVPIERGDVVRVAPEGRRALRASDEADLLVVCAGGVAAGFPRNPDARYLIDDGIPDYDDMPPWYAGRADVQVRNAELKSRMERARERRG